MDVAAIDVEPEPEWLAQARKRLADEGREGRFLAFEGEEGPAVVPIPEGWTRIGRSASAEIRLDDPTVSRRHAVIVSTPGRGLRALDDRSLNGLFVNGEAMEWSHLADGDELEIGRFHLHVIDTTGTPAGTEGTAPALNG